MRSDPSRAGLRTLRRGLPRAAIFAFLWWTLTGGDATSWLIGGPVVVAATVAALALSPSTGWSLSVVGLAAFVPYFLWRSMAGSVDVAWRAFHPRLPISPALNEYPLALPAEGPARTFFADVVSLLPGTLSAELTEQALTVHLLNSESPHALEELRRLETSVGALFRVRLDRAADFGAADD